MNILLDTIPMLEVDPYDHMEYLGHGAYGYVDKVRDKQASNPKAEVVDGETVPTRVYARKVVRISSSRDRESLLRSVLNEFKILNRLDHRHIVRVVQMYQWKNCLSITMKQVAESNLADYLQSVDELIDGLEKDVRMSAMQAWPGCLIQAIDYLHEMKVKHKDLKPANILIMLGSVLIADFGVSKDLIDEETTASFGASGDVGTLMYYAPEIIAENQRRGRAADIYAMGCIFLEISTVLLAPKGSLRRWSLHREYGGSRHYSKCGPQILQWIRYLWGLYAFHLRFCRTVKEPFNDIIYYGTTPADAAFLMLDPNPKTRITARQMVGLIQLKDSDFQQSFKRRSCSSCRTLPDAPNPNLPIHSIYKLGKDLDYPLIADSALQTEAAPNWEAAKRLWLQSHMWW
jgi:serine/threonine protein kinase